MPWEKSHGKLLPLHSLIAQCDDPGCLIFLFTNRCAKCHTMQSRAILWGREYKEVSRLTFLGRREVKCVYWAGLAGPHGAGSRVGPRAEPQLTAGPQTLTLHLGLRHCLTAEVKPDSIGNVSLIISILFRQIFSLYSNSALESMHPRYHSQDYLRKGTLCRLRKV